MTRLALGANEAPPAALRSRAGCAVQSEASAAVPIPQAVRPEIPPRHQELAVVNRIPSVHLRERLRPVLSHASHARCVPTRSVGTRSLYPSSASRRGSESCWPPVPGGQLGGVELFARALRRSAAPFRAASGWSRMWLAVAEHAPQHADFCVACGRAVARRKANAILPLCCRLQASSAPPAREASR